MDFEDQQRQEADDDHEEEESEPEPISIAPRSEPAANFMMNINHHDTKSSRPIAVFDPHAPPSHRVRPPRFKECLKNHAIGIGGHTVDGCGEFMSAGDDGTLESLRCAACGCHRNFHRKETIPHDGGAYFHHAPPRKQLLIAHAAHGGHLFGNNNNYNSRGGPPCGYLVAAAPLPYQRAASPHLALRSISGGGTGDEDEIYISTPGGSTTSGGSGSYNRNNNNNNKRFRTKFTQDQKDKMLQFASRLDWKIQKQDEEIVQRFCEEVGVKRHVLKVWMHNNKQTYLGAGKKT